MRNSKPEKMVQNQIMFWAHKNGFWLHIIESKAQYSPHLKRYTKKLSGAPAGFSDMVGITPEGKPCFIELKAPGKRGNLSVSQEMFLLDAIKRGAFAVVTDSSNHLDDVWKKWKELPVEFDKRDLLISVCDFDKINIRGDSIAVRF